MRMLMSFETRDHRAPRVLALQVDDHREDLVVVLRGRQRRRQVGRDRLGLHEEAAAGELLRRASSGIPASMPFSKLQTISSSERVAWRALREISDMPFLLLSVPRAS